LPAFVGKVTLEYHTAWQCRLHRAPIPLVFPPSFSNPFTQSRVSFAQAAFGFALAAQHENRMNLQIVAAERVALPLGG